MRTLGAITGLFLALIILTHCALPSIEDVDVDTCVGEECADEIDECLAKMDICGADGDAGSCSQTEEEALKNEVRACMRLTFKCVAECARQMKEDLQR